MTTFTSITMISLAALVSIIYLFGKWNLFHKMGLAGWKGLIPIYSEYLIYKTLWSGKAFFISLVATVVSVVSGHLAMNGSNINYTLAAISGALSLVAFIIDAKTLHRLAKAFGHGIGYTAGLLFAEPLFTMILGLGHSEYARA